MNKNSTTKSFKRNARVEFKDGFIGDYIVEHSIIYQINNGSRMVKLKDPETNKSFYQNVDEISVIKIEEK